MQSHQAFGHDQRVETFTAAQLSLRAADRGDRRGRSQAKLLLTLLLKLKSETALRELDRLGGLPLEQLPVEGQFRLLPQPDDAPVPKLDDRLGALCRANVVSRRERIALDGFIPVLLSRLLRNLRDHLHDQRDRALILRFARARPAKRQEARHQNGPRHTVVSAFHTVPFIPWISFPGNFHSNVNSMESPISRSWLIRSRSCHASSWRVRRCRCSGRCRC